MRPLSVFYDYNGEGISYQEISSMSCEKYRQILPDYLLEIWERKGLTYFKDKFLWLVNPDDYTELLSFFILSEIKAHVVMRTALGGLFFMQQAVSKSKRYKIQEGKYYYYCPIFNQITYLAESLADVMNGWLTTKEVYEPLTYWPIYSEATGMLPPINSETCYGFVPAIALGGDLDAKNLKVFPIKEHLYFLSQL